MIIAISDIIVDDEINIRKLDEKIVEEYTADLKEYGIDHWINNWKGRPIITEDRHLWSGFHTIAALKKAFGEDIQIEADVKGRNKRDAMFLATGTNADHGHRRTNADKRAAVLRWLEDEENREWTDGHIAKKCFVSDQFVTNISKELPTVGSSPRPTYRKYEHYGQISWMETAKPKPQPDFLNQIKQATDDSPPDPEPTNNSIPPYDDMDDPDYTEPKGRFENPLYEDPIDKWENDSEEEETTEPSSVEKAKSKVEAKEKHEDHEYEPDVSEIKINPDNVSWGIIMKSFIDSIQPLENISIKDAKQLQRDFRKALFANSAHVSKWLNDRDKDYQENWNQLFKAIDGTLDRLIKIVETRATDGENLKKKYGEIDERK